jgi:hypothetical protein
MQPNDCYFDEQDWSLVSNNVRVPFRGHQGTIVKMLWKTSHLGPVSRERLHNHIYGHDPNGGASSGIIDVLLSFIRRKLETTDMEIINVWGAGWVLKKRGGVMGYKIYVQEHGATRRTLLCHVDTNPDDIVNALREKTLRVRKPPMGWPEKYQEVPKYDWVWIVDEYAETR